MNSHIFIPAIIPVICDENRPRYHLSTFICRSSFCGAQYALCEPLQYRISVMIYAACLLYIFLAFRSIYQFMQITFLICDYVCYII